MLKLTYMNQQKFQDENKSTVVYFPKKGLKNIQENVYKNIQSAELSHFLKQQNQFNTQSLINPKCLQIFQLKAGITVNSIKIKITNISKLETHYLLLDMVDIIHADFRQKASIYLIHSNLTRLLQSEQILFRIDSNPQVICQMVNRFSEQLTNFVFQRQEKTIGEQNQFQGKVSVQQLENALYISLSKLDKRIDFQYKIIQKLREIYWRLIQPEQSIKNSILSSIENLLLQIIDQIEIYGSKCKEMVIKIVRLFEYYLFDESKSIMSILFDKIKPTIGYIIKKLNLHSIQVMYAQFKKVITSHKIVINGEQKNEFIRLFSTNSSLMNQPQSFRQCLKAALGQYSKSSCRENSKIAKIIGYLMNSQVGPLINKFTKQNQYQYRPYQKYKNESHIISSFFSQIENQIQLPNNSCLSCSSFFFLDHRLIQGFSLQIPVISFQNIEKFLQIQSEFLKTTVDFLNHGGGFVTFGIQKKQLQQKVVGDQIKEERKQFIVDQIKTSIKKTIDSLNKSPTKIEVYFAPVSENPTKQKSYCYTIKGKNEIQRNFLENTYVTIVKIWSSNSADVYFLKDNQKPQFFVSENSNIKKLNNRQTIRLIKWKIKTFLRNQQNSVMLTLSQNFFCHQCKHFQHSRERFNNSTKIYQIIQNQKQFQYQEMCLLIARQKDLPLIKRKMLDKGFRCSIQIKFIDKKFASSKHTSVLYIDLQFSRILKEICFNQDFLIRQKSLLAIRIIRHVKLECKNEENELTLQEFRNIQSWIKSDLKNEILQLYEYRVGKKKQFYFEARSKTSCLYIYYLLNHLSFRSSFKQPKGLKQLSKEQRPCKWIKKFPNQ